MRTLLTSVRVHCVAAGLMTLAAAFAADAQVASNSCGSVQHAAGLYGPFDYRTERSKLGIVEAYHFTPQVEALINGQSATIGGDISYLMRTSPNHHRGLLAIMRLVERTKNPQPRDMQYSIDCYFDRAIRFAPDDAIVRMLYARHLGSRKEMTQAKAQLDYAIQLAGDNGLTHFNIGLTFFDLGLYPEALARAHAAKAYGFARPELETKLREKGQWVEPVVSEPRGDAEPVAPTAASAPR